MVGLDEDDFQPAVRGTGYGHVPAAGRGRLRPRRDGQPGGGRGAGAAAAPGVRPRPVRGVGGGPGPGVRRGHQRAGQADHLGGHRRAWLAGRVRARGAHRQRRQRRAPARQLLGRRAEPAGRRPGPARADRARRVDGGRPAGQPARAARRRRPVTRAPTCGCSRRCGRARSRCGATENREAALRFIEAPPGDPGAANLELKCFDNSANPYLVVGSVLAVALAAADRKASLPAEVCGRPGQPGEPGRRAGAAAAWHRWPTRSRRWRPARTCAPRWAASCWPVSSPPAGPRSSWPRASPTRRSSPSPAGSSKVPRAWAS